MAGTGLALLVEHHQTFTYSRWASYGDQRTRLTGRLRYSAGTLDRVTAF